MLNTNAFPSETTQVQLEPSPAALAWRRANALAAWLVSLDLSRDAMLDLLDTATVRKTYSRSAVESVRTLVGAQ